MALGLAGLLLAPCRAIADDAEPEALRWARVDFLRNRVQLLPSADSARRAQISDILRIGDSLRTMRRSRAELRFNDDSLARIGERATFRFTPNTRNFQLTNGTVLLLIPPGKGRSTIQTPNAVTGIQGSALFVRYIPETDTTIVGALTDNPDGPMVLFNRDGTEQQALQANEIGVIEGDQITELYRFDSGLFWESSGLAEGFNYEQDASPSGDDALDGVRQEIREAVSKQAPLPSDGTGVIENPSSFSRPDSETSSSGTGVGTGTTGSSTSAGNAGANANDGTENSEGEATSEEASEATNENVGGTAGAADSETASGTRTGAALTDAEAPTDATSETGTSTKVPIASQSDGDVLEPVPGAAPAAETVEDTVLEGELAEVEEPVVELEFEGTPAEAYLAAPLIESPTQAVNGGGSRLVPTAPAVQSAEEKVDDLDAKPAARQDEIAVPTITTPIDDALDKPLINENETDGIRRPITQVGEKDPNVTEDGDTEEVIDPPTPGSAEPPVEVIVEPPETTTEPPTVEPPETTEPPTEPSTAPPVDIAPVLPESSENPDAPLLLDSELAPETAVPAAPPVSPGPVDPGPVNLRLDPSTDLIPVVIEGADGSNTPGDVILPETPAELVLPEEVPVPEESDPVQSPEPVIEAAPEPAAPEPAPAPTIIEDFDSGVPFDEPEVGGVSLEETLEPVDLPEQVPEQVENPPSEPRSLIIDSPVDNPIIDSPANPTDSNPVEEVPVSQPQPAGPVDERVLL